MIKDKDRPKQIYKTETEFQQTFYFWSKTKSPKIIYIYINVFKY